MRTREHKGIQGLGRSFTREEEGGLDKGGQGRKGKREDKD
jgi:hypothetical protein